MKEKLIKEGQEGQESIERNAANYNRLNDRFAESKQKEAEDNIDKTSEIYDQTTDLKERLIEQNKNKNKDISREIKNMLKFQDCIYPQSRYNKNYNIKYFFVQNKLIVEYVDLVIFFTEDEKITKVNDLKRLVEKQNKSLILKS